jgi:hypothetical protein
MTRSDGPFVAVATFCESVIEAKDATLSLIRMVDRVIVHAQGPEVPENMPPQTVPVTLVVALKSGAARGRQTISVRPEAPSGRQLDRVELPVLFEGEDRGQNVIIQMQFPVEEEGLYWFDVLLGQALLTRVPLRFVYQRLQTGVRP